MDWLFSKLSWKNGQLAQRQKAGGGPEAAFFVFAFFWNGSPAVPINDLQHYRFWLETNFSSL